MTAIIAATIAAIFHFNEKDKNKLTELFRMADEKYGEIYKTQKGIIDDLISKEATLIKFIDKNINERVVYTTKDIGYDNVGKLDEDVLGDDGEEPEEVQEMDASQLEQSQKDSPI